MPESCKDETEMRPDGKVMARVPADKGTGQFLTQPSVKAQLRLQPRALNVGNPSTVLCLWLLQPAESEHPHGPAEHHPLSDPGVTDGQ